MKKQSIFRMGLLILCLWIFSSRAQTLVNQTAINYGSTLDRQYNYFKALPLPSTYGGGQVYIQDNYSIANGSSENLTTTDSINTVINSVDLAPFNGSGSVATAIASHKDNVFVTGVRFNPTGTNTVSYHLMNIDVNTLDTIWTVSIPDSSKYPVAVLPDNDSGYVYLALSEKASNTRADIAIIKYDRHGNKVLESKFDSVGYYNVPVAMSFADPTNIIITGFNFDNTGKSNFITFKMKIDGFVGPVTFNSNGTGAIGRTTNVYADSIGNAYVGGTSTVNGLASVIKVVSYFGLDTSIHLQWASTYGDTTKTNTLAAFCLDGQANQAQNIMLAGTIIDGSGNHSIVVLKYGIDGTLKWSKTIASANPAYPSDAVDIIYDAYGTGNIYVTGTQYNGSDLDLLTFALDSSSNILWQKTYGRGLGTNETPYNILFNEDGTISVTAKSFGTDSQYVLLSYDQYYRPINVVLDTNGKPAYLQNRVLVKFNSSSLDTTVLNNRNKRVFTPSELLTSTAYTAVQAALPFDLGSCHMICLTALTPNDKFCTTRLGQTIPIPPLWSVFALDFPSFDKFDEISLSGSLNALFPTVIYAHPDYTIKADGIANDSLYFEQASLHPTTTFDSASIYVEGAWDYEVGKSFVKVGVVDDGIDVSNVDFGVGIGTGSKIKGGSDWTNNGQPWNFFTSPNESVTSHGTQVAGILGALRNNTIGVAGIAGGDGTVGNQGVPLYIFKILPAGHDTFGFLSSAYEAIVDNSVEGSDHSQGLNWGVNIMNNSWGLSQNSAMVDTTVLALEDAVHFANRNQVTFVASRGNDSASDYYHYPAVLWNSWVLSVGASGNDGKPAKKAINTSCGLTFGLTFTSAIGNNMDIIAPGGACTIETTQEGIPAYSYLNGTSASAPHASGVAALLMSQHNQSTPAFNNLAPEDIEGIEEITAYYGGTGLRGSDPNWGYGRLNATAALHYAWKPKYSIEHYCSQGGDTVYPGIIHNTLAHVVRRVQNKAGQWINTGPYLVDEYSVVNKASHIDSPTRHIDAVWPVSSLSDTYIGGFSSSNEIIPIEDVFCCEVLTSNITHNSDYTYSGSIFDLRDSASGAHIAWLPYDTTYAKDSARMCITFVFDNETISSIHDVNLSTLGIDVLLFPNPSNTFNTLLIDVNEPTELSVNLYDISGQFVKPIWSGKAEIGNHRIETNIENLATGVYVYRINSGTSSIAKRFVKM